MKFYVPVVGFTAFLFFLSVYPSSNAQEWWDDGMTIEQVASSIDNESRKLGGTKIVAAHLKRQFQINDDVIYSLREKKIGYGDINIVLALAEKMPGGINDENISEIVDMRRGKTGGAPWERIAGYLGVEIKPVIHRAMSVVAALPSSVELSHPMRHAQSDEECSGVLIKKF